MLVQRVVVRAAGVAVLLGALAGCLVHPSTPPPPASCGLLNEECCLGYMCAPASSYQCVDGVCSDGVVRRMPDAPAGCGQARAPCCAGRNCAAGATCEIDPTYGLTCVACGNGGQRCCVTGCETGLGCLAGRCMTCGVEGGPCCAGDSCSDGSLSCASGVCVRCGVSGNPCCAGQQCAGGSRCGGTRCGCGGRDQPCCASGARCDQGVRCTDGTCHCGGFLQDCCPNATCDSGLTCVIPGSYCTRDSTPGPDAARVDATPPQPDASVDVPTADAIDTGSPDAPDSD